jgi:hypothetical protein
MIYSHSLSPVYCVEYETFCHLMEIHFGPHSASWRSPAETRTVAAFLYAVNSGRGGVFVNWNRNITIVVPQSSSRSASWTHRSRCAREDVPKVEWDLLPYSFDLSVLNDSLEKRIAEFLKSNGADDGR